MIWVDVVVSYGERREGFGELGGGETGGTVYWWWGEGRVLDECFFAEGLEIDGG
jgi:hypothetical protein